MKKFILALLTSFALIVSPFTGPLIPARAGMSAFTAQSMFGLYFNGTAYTLPSTIYIGLFTTCPTAGTGTGGTEVSTTNWPAYARFGMTVGTTDWTTVTSAGVIKNAIAVSFASNSGSAAVTVACYGAWDASTGGDLLSVEKLTTSQTVNVGGTASFAIDTLTFTPALGP